MSIQWNSLESVEPATTVEPPTVAEIRTIMLQWFTPGGRLTAEQVESIKAAVVVMNGAENQFKALKSFQQARCHSIRRGL
jgi:hypothetical protein